MVKKLVMLACAYMGAALMFTIWATGMSWLTVTMHSAIFKTVTLENLEVMVWISFAISVIVTKALLLIATSDVYKDLKATIGMKKPENRNPRYY